MAEDNKTDKSIDEYRKKIADKVMSGDFELAELRDLENNQKAEEEIGIPSRLRIPRNYTMTQAAREARSKGGKARAKKCPAPNWKHGMYARSSVTTMKPCKTTCEKYPCELIEENKVEPGEACLDMVFVVQTYEAIIKAVKKKEYDDFNEIAAFNISQSIEVLRMCQEDIMREGTMVKSEKYDAFGRVIGYEIKPHPSLFAVIKLADKLGMTPQEAMITPRQIAKQGNEEEGVKSIGDLMGMVGALTKQRSENKK